MTAASTQAPEVLTPETRLTQIAQRSGLTQEAAHQIAQTFVPFVADAGAISREAEGVVVTSVGQKAEIKKSRDLRLKLRSVRIGVEKNRKDLKDESLRRGKLIDDLSNHVKGLIEPVETRLDEQEKIAERQEAERVAKIVKERQDALRPFCEPAVLASHANLADLHEADFASLLNTYKAAHQHRAEQAQRDERERAERQAETARLNAENDRIARELEQEKAKAREAEERALAETRRLQQQMEREHAERAADQRRLDEEARREREAAERQAQAEHEAALKVERDKTEAQRRAAQQEAELAASERRRIEREAHARNVEMKRLADLKVAAAQGVALEALVVLGEVDMWMTAKIGAPPADPEQWQDGHALLASVRDLAAKGGAA